MVNYRGFKVPTTYDEIVNEFRSTCNSAYAMLSPNTFIYDLNETRINTTINLEELMNASTDEEKRKIEDKFTDVVFKFIDFFKEKYKR